VVGGHITASNISPAGLRISYSALAIIVTLVLGLGGIVGSIRMSDLGDIDRSIASVRAAQMTDVQRMERRLERIEDKLDRLVEP